MAQPGTRSSVEDEIKRLRVKLSASDDRDIKEALKLRIEALEDQAAKMLAVEQAKQADEETEADPDELLPEATPEQIRKADELIRQARVEKMRKNSARAATLMKEAGTIAPSSPSVLESLGDELTEQKKYKDARDAYAKALRYAKNNVELEKKHAVSVLRAKGLSSFDAAMRSETSDPIFLTSQDSLASGSGAVFLNAFVPGVGHLAVGKTVGGIALIASSVICVTWIALMHKDIEGLLHMVKGGGAQPNLLVLVPIFGLVVTYIIGFTSLGSSNQLKQNRSAAARPQPPVNLPFD